MLYKLFYLKGYVVAGKEPIGDSPTREDADTFKAGDMVYDCWGGYESIWQISGSDVATPANLKCCSRIVAASPKLMDIPLLPTLRLPVTDRLERPKKPTGVRLEMAAVQPIEDVGTTLGISIQPKVVNDTVIVNEWVCENPINQ